VHNLNSFLSELLQLKVRRIVVDCYIRKAQTKVIVDPLLKVGFLELGHGANSCRQSGRCNRLGAKDPQARQVRPKLDEGKETD
jgi:hypothetical protein